MSRRFTLAFLAALVFAVTMHGTTLVLPTDARLVEKSPVIVVGVVVESRPVLVGGRAIWTESRLAVDRVLKGEAGATLIVREVGGEIEGRVTVSFGRPTYEPGERVLAFLTPTPREDHQTVDLLVGKFSERYGPGGTRIWFRELASEGIRIFDGALQPMSSGEGVQRDADAFERFISETLRGSPGTGGYFIEESAIPMEGSVESQFKLIDPDRVYRWFTFDDGGTETWRSAGSQSGYADGGIEELKSGMSSWTGYAAAKIRYAYLGPVNGTPGGLTTPNGVNEVLFDDPADEIAGTWNGSDGVVGTGGFNAVGGPRSWSSPFAADADHPQASYSAWAITEGNLVIQDGISPSKGIPSAVLAEILAHEFGHTLGFGHSDDATALMYASLQNLGHHLRADDQLAARWLYPAGGSTPAPPPPPALTVPSAPTELGLSALTSELVQIRWTDNADNEEFQTIWFQPSGESFRKFGDVPANVTAASLGGLTHGRAYGLYVTARNEAGESPASNQIVVTIPLPKLEAAFTTAPASGTAGITRFSFYDQSKGFIVSREWSFGDGAESTLANPSHLYEQPGTFEVRLEVRDSSGQMASASRMITVAPAPLFVADFVWEPSGAIAGQPVRFTDQSTGSPSSWSWGFGDGTGSAERSPEKTWDSPGSYPVSLTISNGLQTSRSDRTVTVAAGSGGAQAVSAEFELSATHSRIGEAVDFTDRSAGAPEAWSWSFGDGVSSSLQNPSHAYRAAGVYAVTLTATKGASSSTRTRSLIVREAAHAFHAMIPASAQTGGAGGTDWRTELTIHNAGSTAADATLRYLPDAGRAIIERDVTIPPGASVSWERALVDLFGLESGRGAITLDAVADDETPNLKVSSRTFTDSPDGTYGQFVPAVGSTGSETTLWITGLESSAAYRTNVGWANRESAAVQATFRLWDGSGANLGSAEVNVASHGFAQVPIASLFPFLASQPRTGLTLRITASRPGALVAYASVVDQSSQDPIFLAARPAPLGSSLTVPVVGRTSGAGSTFWRSEVHLFNTGSTQLRLALRLLRSDADNRGAAWKEIDLAPQKSLAIADVFDFLGEGAGLGSLEIGWSGSSTGPVIASRTYTTRDGQPGTYGQSIDGVAPGRFGIESVVTGLRSDEGYRANLGLVNGGDASMSVILQAIAPDGSVLAEEFASIAPRSQRQLSLSSMFPSLAGAESLGAFTLVVRSLDQPALFAYGSVVDQRSGDPVYIAGE
ncbi:MAG TPA: PKD domain-containing protein [Thermoanaerobaculia bacterium]|nr:PKD domain-containing protein [Thermoanaerobaculia bacterium]